MRAQHMENNTSSGLDIIIFGDIMKMSKSNDVTSIFAVLQEAAVA
jgi:hypothetical protein